MTKARIDLAGVYSNWVIGEALEVNGLSIFEQIGWTKYLYPHDWGSQWFFYELALFMK